jgi:hypothetical protein
MEYLMGVGLALVGCAFAMLTGFDRDRVFYPTLLTVIATYYILFAVMGNSTPALAIESAVAGTFLVLAVLGFKKNLWLVVAGLAGHGVFDVFHRLFIRNPGVPICGLASVFPSTFSPAVSWPCWLCNVPDLR